MKARMSGIIAAICGAVVLASGCATTRPAHDPPVHSRSAIPRLLQRQADAWNRGSLEEFMVGYWRSPDLTFSSGGTVTRGWQPMLDRFRESYGERGSMGTLTFSELEVTDLGSDSALVLGKWRLEGADPSAGAFTLVLRHMDGQWLIIHDHTSRDAS